MTTREVRLHSKCNDVGDMLRGEEEIRTESARELKEPLFCYIVDVCYLPAHGCVLQYSSMCTRRLQDAQNAYDFVLPGHRARNALVFSFKYVLFHVTTRCEYNTL